ncbi:MAG: hypothetical protein QNJ55_30430 [Xenococcus sp. MO_188.B8]|nr:hypothetical protein [Xenococcus sp. MO_188.B8]
MPNAKYGANSELYQPKLWVGLKTLVMVIRVRHLWNKTTREIQFYLTQGKRI